jgi:RecB family exonuclease
MRRQLAAAARNLAAVLRAGGYRVAGFEEEVRARALGRKLSGRIDCLVRRADGEEAVIDLKYGGREKYRRLLEEGRAIQLATYAFARAQAGGGRLPAVAYLILEDGLLLTPSGSPLRGVSPARAIAGPSVDEVWRQVAEALPRADRWLTRDEPIPARPLQQPEEWPEGAALAIYDAKGSGPEKREPCRYCRYQILCGFVELT